MVFNSYEEWRATVPWTAKQIADVMRLVVHANDTTGYKKEQYRKWADHVEKTGRISSRALGVALPFLITKCELCERKALYRLGNVGRCSKHRDVKSAAHERQRAWRDSLWGEKEAEMNDRDRLMRAYQSHKRAHRASLAQKA